jgi:hypothetical protein
VPGPHVNPLLQQLQGFFASLISGGVAAQAPGEPGVADELWHSLRQAAGHWVQRWLPYLVAGVRCSVLTPHGPCGGGAIQQCAICQHPTCLQHAMFHTNGDVVCVRCVNEYAALRARQHTGAQGSVGVPPPRQPPPSAQHDDEHDELTRRRYLKTLDLPAGASWDEIQQQFKRLALRYHPDRHQQAAPAKRDRMAAKFKSVTTAYNWLRAQNDRRAA